MEFNQIKTLLADDDAISARILSKVLAWVGCDVTIATDGAEAWQLVRELQPRLVISDWIMPKINGPSCAA